MKNCTSCKKTLVNPAYIGKMEFINRGFNLLMYNCDFCGSTVTDRELRCIANVIESLNPRIKCQNETQPIAKLLKFSSST